MTDHEWPRSMCQVLDHVEEKANGDKVTFGEILQILGTRSYGPVLFVVCLISMLPPISVTPGLPVITGLLILLLSVQLLFLRPYPWFPKWVLRFSFTREKLNKVIEKARPWTRRISKVVHPRLTFLVRPPFLNLIALVCIGLALLVFLLSPLPGGENVPAAAVLFFSLALTVRDGLLALIGLVITGGSIWLLIYFLPFITQAFTSLWQLLGF